MKCALVATLLLLAACGSAAAADYIRINVDTVYEHQSSEWEFYILRECPEPVMLMGISNGWVLNAVGNATWTDFHYPSDFTPFPEHPGWWNLGFLFTDQISGTDMTSGWFLTGGAAMPPAAGMPVITTEKFWFSLNMTMGHLPDGSTGDGILIDSGFVGAAGAWQWSGLTCGEGGAPNRPLFVDKYGSDDQHPILISVQTLLCIAPEISVTPIDDELSGSHCDGNLFFGFTADPGIEGSAPATIEEWSILSGIGTMDSYGHYLVEPQQAGTYPVTIQVTNSCLKSDTYSFDVIFTNNLPTFTNCRDNCYSGMYIVPFGYMVSLPLEVIDPDPCDSVSLVFYGYEELMWTFHGDIYVDGNLLVISPSVLDGGVWLCAHVAADDGQGEVVICDIGYDICCLICGELDHLGIVDIDDAVFLINYVFASGFPPEPYHMADVNCNGSVDIDDIVHIVMYVFAGGNVPCDIDGDGVKDCGLTSSRTVGEGY
jgi:hypothetical protein